MAEPFTGAEIDPYRDLAGDCMGPFLVWWRQQVPGLGNPGVDALGEPLHNAWVYLYY